MPVISATASLLSTSAPNVRSALNLVSPFCQSDTRFVAPLDVVTRLQHDQVIRGGDL
jgi:hypothetical protein